MCYKTILENGGTLKYKAGDESLSKAVDEQHRNLFPIDSLQVK